MKMEKLVVLVLLMFALALQVVYADTVTAIVPIQQCWAEDNATKGSFGGACDFPDGSALQANGGTTETHTANRVGNVNYYGGVKTTSYNSSESECISITSVMICYEWWRDANLGDCDVSVDADGGVSFTAVTTTCPELIANPGFTCYNATATENWNCSHFFGPSGTRAQAKSEARRTPPAGTTTITWDMLYFNVTYRRDREPPTVALISPANASTWNTSNDVLFEYNVTDELSGIANCSLIINDTVYQTDTSITENVTQNFTQTLSNGNYTWSVNCTDDSTNANEGASATWNLTVNYAPPGPYVMTDRASYAACNIVFYKVSVFDPNDQPIDSSLDISILNTTNITVEYLSTATGNGGTGVYLGSYFLNATADFGNWTIKALAGFVKEVKQFIVG